MKQSAIILALALGVSAGSLTAQEEAGPPPAGERPQPPPGGPQQKPGPRLLPPGAAEFLKLTPEQIKQVADLEAEVKAKIEKILTPAQLEQIKQMRPPLRPGMPGGQGPGGQRPGGRGPGGPGGQGNPGGPPDGPDGQAPPPPPALEE